MVTCSCLVLSPPATRPVDDVADASWHGTGRAEAAVEVGTRAAHLGAMRLAHALSSRSRMEGSRALFEFPPLNLPRDAQNASTHSPFSSSVQFCRFLEFRILVVLVLIGLLVLLPLLILFLDGFRSFSWTGTFLQELGSRGLIAKLI